MDFELHAENEGFEPPVPYGTIVFKTTAFDRSANSPLQNYINFLYPKDNFQIIRYIPKIITTRCKSEFYLFLVMVDTNYCGHQCTKMDEIYVHYASIEL
jgi:hypothetical protein